MAGINLPLEPDPVSPPPADTVDLYYSSTTTPPTLSAMDSASNIARLTAFGVEYHLIGYTEITATGTYTPPAGTRALRIQCWGPGGGGAGVATAVTNSGAAGGGGAGAYAEKFLETLVDGNHAVTVPAGGAGGTAGANNGTPGGGGAGVDTDFKDTAGTSVCTAKFGSGGIADSVALGPRVGGLGGAGGIASTSTGDIKQQGSNGRGGIVLAAAQAMGGMGANGFQNGGGGQERKTQGAGNAATGVSAGGAGACILSGGASVAGGNGGNGYILVWEYA